MTPPETWPPLGQEQAASTAPPEHGQATLMLDQGPALPRQFVVLLAEVLAGVRPERQVASWLSKRGSLHLHRVMPLFNTGHQPRVLRVVTTRPAPDVIEMTMILVTGARPRALAIRLEHSAQPTRWQCTDIESA